ncbi:MAG: hypothetical protein RUDDFDWM_001820 [Candidatus Fervidibacterota bacterium]
MLYLAVVLIAWLTIQDTSHANTQQLHGLNYEPVGWEAFDILTAPILRRAKAFQASSSDPTGGNDDKGHFISLRSNVATLLDVKGSGCIYRIWSANPMGEIRIYIDYEHQPMLKMPFVDFFKQRRMPFVSQLVGKEGGGGYCYVPITFKKLARIEVENPSSLYYQITYHIIPSAVHHEQQTMQCKRALERLTKWMQMPTQAKPPDITSSVIIPPKVEKRLFELRGEGMLTCIALRINPTKLKVLHSLRLRAYWDGETNPSIDVPIAYMMCIPFGWVQFNSLFVDVRWEQLVFRLPMPFSRSAILSVVNDGSEQAKVECNAWRSNLPLDERKLGRLHAWLNCSLTKQGIPHTILRTNGRGHLVGIILVIVGKSLECYEGDLNIKVDGETTIRGTGTEDEFNSGWYFISGSYATPFAGTPILLGAKTRSALYRWMLTDCIPFSKTIEASIEHGPNNNCPGCLYRSVAFWYQTEPHAKLPSPPPLEELIPPPFSEPDAQEAEDLQVSVKQGNAHTLKVVEDDSLPTQLSNGKGVRIIINGTRKMQFATMLKVPRNDTYDVFVRYFATDDLCVEVSVDEVHKTLKLMRGVHTVNLLRRWLEEGELKLNLCLWSDNGKEANAVIDYFTLTPLERAKGALEAEELKVVEGNAKVIFQGEKCSPYRLSSLWEGEWRETVDLSGGRCILFEPKKPMERLSLEFDANIDGSYEVALGLLAKKHCGKARVFVDGQAVGGTINGYSDEELAWHQIGLGVTKPLKAGKRRLTIESVDGKPLFIDYIVLQPTLAGYQAERMFILSSSRQPKIRKRFGAEPPWRGGAYLKLDAKRAGESMTFLLPSFKSGVYSISMTIAGMPSGGMFEVLVDGKRVGEVVDSYSQTEKMMEVDIGYAKLRRGLHALTLRTVGKNPASGGYTVGCDEIKLQLQKTTFELTHFVGALMLLLALATLVVVILRKQRSRT